MSQPVKEDYQQSEPESLATVLLVQSAMKPVNSQAGHEEKGQPIEQNEFRGEGNGKPKAEPEKRAEENSPQDGLFSPDFTREQDQQRGQDEACKHIKLSYFCAVKYQQP